MKKSIFVLSFLASLSVFAGDAEFTALTNKFSSLFDDLEYEAGLKLVEEAWKKEGKSREQVIELLKWRALFLSALKRPAEDTYTKILCLQPDFEPAASLSPKMRQPFERAKAKAPRPLQVGLLAPGEVLREQSVDFQFEKTDDCGVAQQLVVYLSFQEGDGYKVYKVPVAMVTQKRIALKLKEWPLTPAKTIYWYATVEDETRSLLWQEGSAQKPNAIPVRDPQEMAKTDPMVARPLEPPAVKPWYKQWWVWTIAGAALVAAGTTTAVLLTRDSASGPANILIDFTVGP